MPKSKNPRRDNPNPAGDRRNSRSTVSGPTSPDSATSSDDLAAKLAGTQELASRFPFNTNKALEYDPAAATAPEAGQSVSPRDPIVGSSTVTELTGSEKVGSGGPPSGNNKTIGPLDRRRVAILVADGVEGGVLKTIADRLTAAGAVPRFVGARLGTTEPASGDPIEVDATMEAVPSRDGESLAKAFINALGKHRHFDREGDPPLV